MKKIPRFKHLSVCLSVCLLPVCLSACLPVCLSPGLTVCLSVCLSDILTVCLLVCEEPHLSGFRRGKKRMKENWQRQADTQAGMA